jgi:Zn-dependent alcohol dehydrogenase|tara:strand:- start:19 stop:567 length:549 start_codon:yes stop_codon:yes gene_type:complete
MKNLNKTLAVIQTKLKAKKSSYNSFGKYYFRKAEDILEAAKPFLIENSVSITITEEVIPGHTVPIVQSTAIISDGENSIQATAVVGVDLNQKGMQTAQQFGAASTYGKKYALGNLFLIDDTEDADATNTHGRASQIVNKAKAEMTADQLKKAIEFVKGGGAISSIETKYNVTEKQMKTLQNG